MLGLVPSLCGPVLSCVLSLQVSVVIRVPQCPSCLHVQLFPVLFWRSLVCCVLYLVLLPFVLPPVSSSLVTCCVFLCAVSPICLVITRLLD